MVGDLLYLIAGGAATWILQALKAVFKLEGRAMMWMAILVSLALGVVVTGFTSGWAALLATPWLIFTGGSAVFATAQVIYKELAAKFDLSVGGMVVDDTTTTTAAPKARAAAPKARVASPIVAAVKRNKRKV